MKKLKEKIKKMGRNFWIGLGVAVVVLLIIILVSYSGDKIVKDGVVVEEGPEGYYEVLEGDCNVLEQSEVGCCIISINLMEGKEYLLADDGECPEGLELKDLGCAGSYEWCE